MSSETTAELSNSSNSVATAETVWRVINNPLVAILSDLQNNTAERTIRVILGSILKGSANLTNVLVPPQSGGENYENLERQYTEFTIWLFGTMFYISGAPFSTEVHSSSLEVQACMLRILATHYPPNFNRISSELLDVLEDTVKFEAKCTPGDQMEITRFQAESGVIGYLDLISLPLKIPERRLQSLQISISKIILKIGVTQWNQSRLWDVCLKMIVDSSPDVKFLALKIATQMMERSLIGPKDKYIIIVRTIEMVKLIPTWKNLGVLSAGTDAVWAETLTNFVRGIETSPIATSLCYEVIDLTICNDFDVSSERLREAACAKVTRYLLDNPTSCTPEDITKCSIYLENWTGFLEIMQHLVLNDIESSMAKLKQNSLITSETWSILGKIFTDKLQRKEFHFTLEILKCSSWLDFQIAQANIDVSFYGRESESIALIFINELRGKSSVNQTLIFENINQLCRHREVKNVELHEVLLESLPHVGQSSVNVRQQIVTAAKSLDVTMKIKSLDTLCQFGNFEKRLPLIKICVISDYVELAVAAIRNLKFAIGEGKSYSVTSVIEIMNLATASAKEELRLAAAECMGGIFCLLSGRAVLAREVDRSTEWVIKCADCDKVLAGEKQSAVCNVPFEVERFLLSQFKLFATLSTNQRLLMSRNFLSFSNHTKFFNSNTTARVWLPYIRDDSKKLRENVGKAILYVIQNKIELQEESKWASPDLKEFETLLMQVLTEVLESVLASPNLDLHLTIVETAQKVASFREHLYRMEEPLLKIFLITILHTNSNSIVISTAVAAFQEIAACHETTPKLLYHRYKRGFLDLMIEMAVRNCINHSYNLATSLHRAAKCVGYQGSRQLLHKDGNYAICALLPWVIKFPQVRCLCSDMAELITMTEKDMFVEYFQYICPHVLINENKSTGQKCLLLIESITKTSISDLMSRSFMGIFSELMLHFHTHIVDVIQHLEVLSQFDMEYEGKFDSRENVAAYLKPRLHGVLVNLDSNLSSRSDETVQKLALGSLAVLMQFMGERHLTPLRFKLLGTLRTSLSFSRPGFQELVCDAWDSFLHNIAVGDLGPLIPTIFISLATLLERRPDETSAMMEYLVIERNREVADYIPELFFIDDLKVPEKIAAVVKQHIASTRPNNFEDNLSMWLKRTVHETHEIRYKALIYLKKFLADSRSHLNDTILSGNVVDPLIVELLDTLLNGCRDKDENFRLASGECLGELGAVEPSLLPRRIQSKDESKFIFETNEEFACLALTCLVRAFQSQKNTQSMGCFALAIQEILKTYSISPDGTNRHCWKQFPNTIQQMIHPFLNSHYKITTIKDGNEYPHPIYGSEEGSTFNKWSYNWICSMSDSVHDSALKNLIAACRPAFRRDVKSLVLFIPYVVSHIVANGNPGECNKIGDEILAVINVIEQTSVDKNLVDRRPLRYQSESATNSTRISDEDKRIHCSQVVFSILDHLQRWLRERRSVRDEKYRSIKRFCKTFNSLILAQGCYQTQEYHRSLMYLEDHMTSSNQGLAESMETGLLAKIYAQLEEPDGVSGILATQDEVPTLQQLVLAHEVSGQLQDAATCYERLAQGKNVKPKYLQGMVQCYLGLDHPFTATNITEGILNNRPELQPLIVDDEIFWRLADFSQLDDMAKNTAKKSLLNGFIAGLPPDLSSIKQRLVSMLGAASRQGTYQQSYPQIMKLHILNEFEKAAAIMLVNPEQLPDIFDEWEMRGQLVRASRGVESVLSMRRATLDLAVQLQRQTTETENSILKQEIGKIWLKSAKIARKSRLYQQAYMYILSASDSCPPQELYIEQAQLYWQKGCQEEAFTTLKRCFANCFQPSAHYKQMPPDSCVEERRQCARAKLLYAKYNDETLNVDTDGNISNYKEAIEVWRVWEKSLLSCARYYESIVDRMSDEERDVKGRDLQIHMMNYYGKSLQYGCKYIHQSMPRLLTIWLDFASRLQVSNGSSKIREDALTKMTKLVEVYLERLPTFMWLTAFSQLVSRICHPCREVQNTLCSILVKLISAYPQHCLWMMAAVFKSAYPVRQKRCQEIFNHPDLRVSRHTKLIQDFNRLWERLIELSNKAIPEKTASTTVSALSKYLPRLLASSEFGQIMIPTTKFRQLHLPSKVTPIETHNPFPTQWAHIVGIEDRVMVMQSLQRPRRITLRGSDGRQYLFMCKPKDDLRRDFRLMEFNDIVNKYLQKDPESRQRRLYIRTYSVVPLNEECGLIEWVHNLVGFRPILLDFYKERGNSMSARELKNVMCQLRDPLEKKRKVFLDVLLPRHPPVLGEWFRLTFPDPYGWYEARTAYIRTTAVMSMVGYILGLGDRHGENILFDSKCGDCVHVDFNCLFNRGEFFDWPERVPFRLTNNMVEAMGPLKYEGPFRRACQTTMRVLREQATTLVSVLTPFVYDPLLSWNKNQPDAAEKTNEKAVENIKNIEQRLKGLLRSQGKKADNIALNLSVEGQTNHLILEATNVDNLCQMYVGWGPYL
ncbi:serine/threonine-protein kinase ATR isoform X2 [Diprion similis]|uniref:serine/threonine-protein kinase ATR isoform X2 n=1 Tax=Diprion similis TaxID=362088 RepID=UPI001EF8E341|nr:serine/threonine-protein kinase ATR isoform X2 [Diprion similis]